MRDNQTAKANRRRVEQAFNASCHGVQIDIMDIGKVFTAGLAAIAEGADDATLQATIITFVQTIRKN